MAINLDNVQGNIFGGFNKDFQDFLFLKVANAAAARLWVRTHADDWISSSKQVLAYNNAFKALLASGVHKPEAVFSSRWANIAFSFGGLQALGFTNADHGALPQAFTDGMAARKTSIGDIGTSDPSQWPAPFDAVHRPAIHAILLVSADSEKDLNDHIAAIKATSGFATAFHSVGTVHGRTRADEPGHEHFGFKDGVSQPGIRGINEPDDPLANADQGHPGQDLLWPGEFVLGYPTQIPTGEIPPHDGPNRSPGAPSTAGLASWTNDGSFLVFRRLEQDVPAFHQQLGTLAAQNGTSVDLMGAKLVGRYRSGCPLEALSMQPFPDPPSPTDPGLFNPALADSDALNNAFEFGDDVNGARCPLAAHIRKAYPRDEDLGIGLADSESQTQTRRLLRRGIPYGASFGAAKNGDAAHPRGLCFLAYQKDIAAQFEFVQQTWVNTPTFPSVPARPPGSTLPGQDPIIAQSASSGFELVPGRPGITVAHFVKTTGGEYFFAPSLDTMINRF